VTSMVDRLNVVLQRGDEPDGYIESCVFWTVVEIGSRVAGFKIEVGSKFHYRLRTFRISFYISISFLHCNFISGLVLE